MVLTSKKVNAWKRPLKWKGGRKAPVVVQKSGKEKRRALKERLTLKV